MTSLVEFLDSLRLEDGQPDMQARRTELESLVHNISLDERRYLKDQLHPHTFQKDICGHLPTELLLHISSCLDLKDLMGARAVSRAWNRAFTNLDMTLAIVKTHFGPEWKDLLKNENPEMQHEQHQTLSKWLPRAASRRIRRLQGRYYSKSLHKYEEVPPLEGLAWPASRNPQYCNGRVAYNRDNRSIVVWNLKTNTTAVVMEENRVEIHQWELSDEYIVCWEAYHRSPLFAMPLDDTGQDGMTRRISLPSSVLRVSISHNQVAIITTASEVMIWTIGGSLKLMKTGKLPDTLAGFIEHTTPSIESASFHAHDKHNIYIVYRGSNLWVPKLGDQGHLPNIVIQEYLEGEWVATHVFQKPHAHEAANLVKFSRLEDNRAAAISFLERDDVRNGHYPDENAVIITQMTAFGFYTHIWTSQSSTLPEFPFQALKLLFTPPMVDTSEILLWRNQILHFNYYDKRLISIADPSLPSWISDLTEWDIDIDAIRGPGVNDRGEPTPTRPSRISIQGDDDFVVCSGDEGYCVWFFDKEAEAARVATLRRERIVDVS
ncbi:hypothetical protein BJ875DRAFT_437657 [Amylocarpus encephaloides]|uniref:F-box domain-containing protein n=1 Tax=Amylocarpus encephaloides TaxID=45428 RepID=A0A9P7YRD4_9HELO|nr:hypothetical protein BJ875DRAFT_437657 [Amylocarpus encephaloides]